MAKYETIMALSLKNGAETAQAIYEKFKALIETNGKIVSVEEWGQRNLAYPINDETNALYVLVNFECEADFLAELDRVYNITEGVLRTIIVAQG